MRIFLTILFLWVYTANATNYHVANAGDDTHDGLTPATAWKTIAKVNSYSSSTGFVAGDSILFNRGDSWNESLRLVNSGSVGSHIIVSAYGAGVKPLITGFQTLTGFVNTSGSIWTVTASNSVLNLNTVLSDGKIKAKGRYPNAAATNSGYLTYQTSTQTSITSSSLTGTPSYVGKECVVRTAAWIIDVVKVASQSTGTLNFASSLTYNPSSFGGTGFFFQNDSSFLDVQGEWSYDSATKRFQIYSTTLPTVQISTIDTLIYVNHNNYITFDNISVTGANKAAFQFDSLSNITVQNCSINNSGTIALSAQKCSYLSALNDSIQNSLSGAIYWRRFDPYTPTQDTCNYATVNGCYIKNTAVLPGMGLSNNGRYVGVYVIGHQLQIINNRIDSTGYIAIFFNGDTSLIKNNFVSNYSFIKDDGGGIDIVVGSYIPHDFNNGSIIRKNVVINGIGALNGTTSSTSNISPGIYLDALVKNITVDSNSIYHCYYGLVLNGADSNNVKYNNVYTSTGNTFYNSGYDADVSAGGNQIKSNSFYSDSSLFYVSHRANGTNVGTIDSNYYSRPSNENNALLLTTNNFNLAQWQSATGKDIHSHITPQGVSKTSPAFVYNPTMNDSTVVLNGQFRSITGGDYNGSITLKPFTSAILFYMPILYKTNAYKHFK